MLTVIKNIEPLNYSGNNGKIQVFGLEYNIESTLVKITSKAANLNEYNTASYAINEDGNIVQTEVGTIILTGGEIYNQGTEIDILDPSLTPEEIEVFDVSTLDFLITQSSGSQTLKIT